MKILERSELKQLLGGDDSAVDFLSAEGSGCSITVTVEGTTSSCTGINCFKLVCKEANGTTINSGTVIGVNCTGTEGGNSYLKSKDTCTYGVGRL